MFEILIIVLPILLLLLGAAFLVPKLGRGKDLEFSEQTESLERPAQSDADDLSLVPETQPTTTKPTFAARLGKARKGFSEALGGVFGGSVNSETWETLEEALIRADIGVATSMSLIEDVKAKASEAGIKEASELSQVLQEIMTSRLDGKDRGLQFAEADPSVWLFVGVNGVGKTTTIGKLGQRMTEAGNSVMMAAGDTFRAAAGEQLTMWAERTGSQVVTGGEGSDPSSVVFDGIAAAAARDCNLVLADTAGRLQNKSNLMQELTKIRRVAEKGEGTVSEVLLVIDATTGQNGLSQAKVFAEAVAVTGVVLTKLDGSAKGGIVFAIESELGLPVKLVGLGESAEDLMDFDPKAFVEALFD